MKLIKYLTDEEQDKLLSSLFPDDPFYERNKAFISLALNTGLRVSELTGLNIGDVINGHIKKELKVRGEIAKGKKERTIPLNKKAREAIKIALDFNQGRGYPTGQKDPLFISKKKTRLTSRQVQNIIKDVREIAEIDVNITPHSLRHTFATRVYKKTGNLRVVQTLLGHSSIQTTEIYTHVRREDLQEAVNLL